jgi:hypothetical protein
MQEVREVYNIFVGELDAKAWNNIVDREWAWKR